MTPIIPKRKKDSDQMKGTPMPDTGRETKRKRKAQRKPIEHGITKKEFLQILDKASQPIKKPESGLGKSGT